MTTGKALNGKPYAGNPHVRFDEGAGAPRHSGRSALLYMHQMTRLPNLALTREGLSQAVVGLTAVLSIMAAGGAAPKTATIIPAPREMRVTGGEYVAEKPPTLEKVDGIPREGYEISITTNGITIRHSKAGGDSFSSLLPKTTMGMCWRTWGAGPRAANKGYGIVQCPMSHCYFDYGQGLSEDPYFYIGGKLPLERVYTFDPFAGVDAGARKNVMGGQCCNWASHTSCRFDLEWKLWPRGFALAEVLWTYPDPAKRDFKEFSVRAAEYRRRLVAAHVNCAPLK